MTADTLNVVEPGVNVIMPPLIQPFVASNPMPAVLEATNAVVAALVDESDGDGVGTFTVPEKVLAPANFWAPVPTTPDVAGPASDMDTVFVPGLYSKGAV